MNFYKFSNLLESFDKSVPFARSESGSNYQTYKFNILEDEYTVEFVHKARIDEEGVYELYFSDQSGSLELTGKNDAFAVFSTILNIIPQFIKDKNPQGFYFTSNEYRQSIYARLAQKIKSKIGWNFSTSKDGQETKFLFIKL